jgi:hypothetical protein
MHAQAMRGTHIGSHSSERELIPSTKETQTQVRSAFNRTSKANKGWNCKKIALVALVTIALAGASVASGFAAVAVGAAGVGFAAYVVGTAVFGAAALINPVLAHWSGIRDNEEGGHRNYLVMTLATTIIGGIAMAALPLYDAGDANGLFGESDQIGESDQNAQNLNDAIDNANREGGEYTEAQGDALTERGEANEAKADMEAKKTVLDGERAEQAEAAEPFIKGFGQDVTVAEVDPALANWHAQNADVVAAEQDYQAAQETYAKENGEAVAAEDKAETELGEWRTALSEVDSLRAGSIQDEVSAINTHVAERLEGTPPPII